MKIFSIINAIGAFNKLTSADMPIPDAYKLQKLTAALQTDIAFFNEQNEKIIKKHGGEIQGNGTVRYPEENTSAAQAEFEELISFETQTEIQKITIKASENINISVKDITALEPFVEFII